MAFGLIGNLLGRYKGQVKETTKSFSIKYKL